MVVYGGAIALTLSGPGVAPCQYLFRAQNVRNFFSALDKALSNQGILSASARP